MPATNITTQTSAEYINNEITEKDSNENDSDDWQIDTHAKQFCAEQLQRELTRIRQLGAQAIPIPVKNMGLVVDSEEGDDNEQDLVVNRIEFDTGFDFTKIKQIMLSDPIDYGSDNKAFLFVLLFTEKTTPLIVPFIYQKQISVSASGAATGSSRNVKNTLKQWLLINSRGERARHQILTYY